MIKSILSVILLLLAVPLGLLLVRMTKEEIKQGKRWFQVLLISSLILALVFLFLSKTAETLALLFISIVSLISLKNGKF